MEALPSVLFLFFMLKLNTWDRILCFLTTGFSPPRTSSNISQLTQEYNAKQPTNQRVELLHVTVTQYDHLWESLDCLSPHFPSLGEIFCGDLINEHSVGLSLGNKNLIWEFWFSCSGTGAKNKQISMWRSSGTSNTSKTLRHASHSNLRSESQQNSVWR